MSIEVEWRGVVDEDQFKGLSDKLLQFGATDLGENNTQTVFYLAKGYQLKVQWAESKCSAKIAWKSGQLGSNGAQEEIEVQLPEEEYQNTQALVERLIPDAERVTTIQRRHDYSLDGLTVSLKYSQDWGYHIEIDKMVKDASGSTAADQEIQKMANRLGVTLLSKEEEAAFVQDRIAQARADKRVDKV